VPIRGEIDWVTFDDPQVRSAANKDPRGFLDRPVDTMVIDEAQLVPTIFRAVKAEVDRDRRPSRFLLTGSSRLLAAPDMADSLIGRVDVVELWPFSQGEIDGRRDGFVDAVFGERRVLMRNGTLSRSEIAARVCRGGFPEAVGRDGARRARWMSSYATTSLQKVVGQLADIERLAELPRLLRLCAARTATELNVASIANELGIPARTGSAYLAHLETAFVLQLIPAWSTNLSSKVVHRPKVSIVDSGLAAHLIGQTPASLLSNPEAFGQLLETFVGNELRRQLTWSETQPTLWHFRDRNGPEVDLLLEAPDGRIVGIEVKATKSPSSGDFRGLRFLADRLGSRFVAGVVLSLAPEAVPMGDRMMALPVESLWRGTAT
jgi:predicted AAA+ superfamily ATPase